MTEEQYVQVVRDIEAAKGQITGHQLECVQFRQRIEERMGAFQRTLDEVKAAVLKTDSRGAKWKDRVLYSAVAVLFGFGSWAAGQLWSMLPLHH